MLNVLIVFLQYLAEELVFGMVNSLDDVLVVAGKIKEATAFTRRAQLRENVLAGERHEVVCGIYLEDMA